MSSETGLWTITTVPLSDYMYVDTEIVNGSKEDLKKPIKTSTASKKITTSLYEDQMVPIKTVT